MKIHFISTTLTPRGLELVYQYKAKDWIEKNLLTALPHRSPMRQVIPEKIYKEFMDKNNLRRSVYYLMAKEWIEKNLLTALPHSGPGWRLIRDGYVDLALVGGSEAATLPYLMEKEA